MKLRVRSRSFRRDCNLERMRGIYTAAHMMKAITQTMF